MFNRTAVIPKQSYTYRLPVIHTLQEEAVELRGLCPLYSKNIRNPDEEVIFNVSVQLPATCGDICLLFYLHMHTLKVGHSRSFSSRILKTARY